MPIRVTKRKTLRDYQNEAVAAIKRDLWDWDHVTGLKPCGILCGETVWGKASEEISEILVYPGFRGIGKIW